MKVSVEERYLRRGAAAMMLKPASTTNEPCTLSGIPADDNWQIAIRRMMTKDGVRRLNYYFNKYDVDFHQSGTRNKP